MCVTKNSQLFMHLCYCVDMYLYIVMYACLGWVVCMCACKHDIVGLLKNYSAQRCGLMIMVSSDNDVDM